MSLTLAILARFRRLSFIRVRCISHVLFITMAFALALSTAAIDPSVYLEILCRPADEGLYQAAYDGDFDQIKFFIGRGANNWISGMCGAAEGGHVHLELSP